MSIVNDIVSGSHDALEQLFISAGATGESPALAHHSKWKMWLRQISDDPNADAQSILGKIIEEYMEVEPSEESNDFHNIFGFDTEYERYHKNKKRLIDALAKEGLRYEQGGKIISIPKGFGIKSLSDSLKRREFHSLEVEFKRALENVDKDPAAAITASCSILEALFTAYLENHLLELPNKQSIKPLWNKVKTI